MDDIYSFGYYVRRRRKALDLTQRELAEAVGCALVTLKKIETDQRRPSLAMAVRLAECLALPEHEWPAFLAAARGERAVDTLPAQPTSAPFPSRDVIPATPTPLIGREEEIATTLALLALPNARLITFVGLGGIGKTRLALAAAAALQATQPRPFTTGIVFVDLAAVDNMPGMVSAVAAALGFEPDTRGRDPRPPLEQLANFLRPRDTLLILDNLEQIDGARRVIDDLLRATTALKILATSRERLDLPWEHLLALTGLLYPAKATADPAAFPAGRLFLARARRLRPTFGVGPDDRRALAQLCSLVDGMPLALELAAAWVDTLSLDEITAELHGDFELADDAHVPERHRSLRVVWDSVWARLSPSEQAAFARLCVFRGGFTRPAAEAVAGVNLGLLGRLSGKYLITLDRDAGRYRVHELLRQYGYANLESMDAAADTQRRHFDYYLAFVETLEPRIHGPEQPDVFVRLEAETDNLNAALEWSLKASPRIEKAARLMSTLHWYWRIRSRVTEASAWVERALAGDPADSVGNDLKPAPTMRPATGAQLLFEAGHFAWMRGDFSLARDRQTAALALWQAAGLDDSREAAITHQHLAMAYGFLGEPQIAALHQATALTRYRELGQRWWVAFILPQIAQNQFTLGDRGASDRAAAEHLELAAQLGDPWLTGLGRLNLGELAWEVGDYARARQLTEEGLAAQRAVGHTHSVGSALMMLGDIAVAEDDRRAASAYYREALALYEMLGHAGFATEARALLQSTTEAGG